VRNSVPSHDNPGTPDNNPGTPDNKVTVHARTRYGDIIIQRAAS
jgi:hypothetical protein